MSQRAAISAILSSVSGALVAVLALAACSSGPQCVIDTDCPLGQRCASSGTCAVVGEALDGGGRSDAGDASVRDGAMADAARDGATDDAAVDAGATCPMITADTYVIVEPLVGSCVFPTGAQVTIAAGATSCDWTAASVADPVVDGTFAIAADGAITASLRVMGAAEPTACTGTYDAVTTRQIAFTCAPDCVITIAPTTAM